MDNVGNVNTLLAVGRRAGVSRYVVHSVATTPEQVSSINTFLASQCREHGELIGFGEMCIRDRPCTTSRKAWR